MATKHDLEDLEWIQPKDARRWHIAEGGRSLCHSWMYPFAGETVEESDSYTEGQDCKKCCERAGLIGSGNE